MKKYSQWILGFAIILGIFNATETNAHASHNYSARRSNSVKLVWRKTMGKHTLMTKSGALYSKHLGSKRSYGHALTNQAVVTTGHEKLYRKAKKSSAVYYHVTSVDGRYSGWIWRGYLTKKSGDGPSSARPVTSKPISTNFIVPKKSKDHNYQDSQKFTKLVSEQMHRDGYRQSQNLSAIYTAALSDLDDWTGTLTKSILTSGFGEEAGPLKLQPKDLRFIYSATGGKVGSETATPMLDSWNQPVIERVLHTAGFNLNTGETGTLINDLAKYFENVLSTHRAKNFYLVAAIGYPGSLMDAGWPDTSGFGISFHFLYSRVADGK